MYEQHSDTDADWNAKDRAAMNRALELAEQAAQAGEVPVGAVLVDAGGTILGEGWNQPISACDPAAHAEIVALRNAARNTGNYRLPGCTLYVTIEPCTMCAGALVHSRIERVVIAAAEPKAGAVVSQAQLLDAPWCNHRVRYELGLCGAEASEIMSRFFRRRRQERKAARKVADSGADSE
ncbi:tRNA adenosine(34) deaminase TadA [Gilvimarinus sp. F26214L]|uniref:tRNA adenosine(34) deaminase TadA n=1 Tax=Gilvimarinus sp. DZF01 TaxID=3461371 RepID=UPI004045A304